MNHLLSQHIEDLKAALLSLPATGHSGFEGLIGATLREITGVPFRLAGSGSQFGVDGKSTYEEDAICFEGKRYDGTIPRNEVLSKIAELPLTNNNTDFWVLGATSQIASQLADDVRRRGAKDGIVALILDWSETDLPPLAVALAMGETRVQEFLKNNIKDKKALEKAIAAIKAVRSSKDFAHHADRIRALCNEPTVGLSLAQSANTNWLIDAFSSRRQAKIIFGQPLAPCDNKTANIRPRKILNDKLYPYFTSAPDETVVFILGGEGNGKSWIVAQSWLALERKPLMVVMSPDDFTEIAGKNDVIDLLIYKLIKQTGDGLTETIPARWRKMFGRWRNSPKADGPRLIVVIDGINQRPKPDWALIIAKFADELIKIGGRLMVTARTPYFRDRVKGRLSIQFIEISVPEWTETERDEILTEHGITASNLHHTVVASLRNPRLLGIALELLDKADITNFEELSVSRLLFEHIRTNERDAPVPQPMQEFVHRLQKHAQLIVSRVRAKQQDDLDIFEDDMGAVADGRFFRAVDGDPARYSLKDEGLTLALGFAVIDRLRTAQRNGHSLDAELDAILEPIAALDDTADVILAALTVTAVDEPYEDRDIATAIIKGFTVLQNPDQTQFPVFVGLSKKRPLDFMNAAQMLILAGGHQPNFDWVQEALIIAGKSYRAWQMMADKVHSWLSGYSLSPALGSFSHPGRDPQDKVQKELEKNHKKIEEKLQALSVSERAILNNLHTEDGDLSSLSGIALLLLAGKPLTPFVKSLLNWSFSTSLNSDHREPYKDFMHLVRLNRVDWSECRKALLEASAPLRGADVSITGKWALVTILRATGQSDDGKEALSLVENLTKDWSTFGSWRLVEKYCATDPCDPESEEPENVIQTAQQYAEINVAKLRQLMGQTSEDLFFDMARPGVARFKREVAIAKHREFIANVLNRTGIPLRQGLIELRHHNALLTNEDACKLVKKQAETKTTSTAADLTEKEDWYVSQCRLLLAFPFLSAQEQAKILLSDEKDENILLDLMKILKPLSEKEFECLLKTACADDNERKQYLLLAMAIHSSVRLSESASNSLAVLFHSESKRVRTQALGVIAQSNDEMLLRLVAKSGWKSTGGEPENSFEGWYGSVSLIKAAARGLITHDEALNRISPRLYGWAAVMLDSHAVRAIACRIDASINRAAGLKGDLVAPDIEIQIDQPALYEPIRFSVSERSPEAKNTGEAMMRLSEGAEAFEERQRRSRDAFLEFKADLTQAKAQIILDHLSLEEFITVVAAAQELAERWYKLFISIPEGKLPAVHNLILLLAHALEKESPDKAEELFNRVKESKPLVRFTFGKTGVPLDAMTTWAGIRCSVLDSLRFARLDSASNDHDLSIEVIAALLNGQRELLTDYTKEKLHKEEPSEISRAIMVAGFSDQCEFNDEIIKRYEGSAGLIGSAQKAAKYAYERNAWARHWYEMMCQTEDNTDFWCYAVLFSKIVDGRFDIWHSNYAQKGSLIKSFRHAVLDKGMLKNRFVKWEDERKKQLYGSDAPTPIFLEKVVFND